MNRGDRGPSRSARKRESHSLQELGERLVNLPADALAKVPLPEELATAVLLARRIKERGGRRRQLRYIGKLMRRADTQPIADALKALDAAHHEAAETEHRVEQWRDRLLREGAGAIPALLEEQPGINADKLAAMIDDAAAENAAGKPPRTARALFRYLRDEVFIP